MKATPSLKATKNVELQLYMKITNFYQLAFDGEYCIYLVGKQGEGITHAYYSSESRKQLTYPN